MVRFPQRAPISGTVQREGAVLFGVIDLAWRQTTEFAATIGLRTANDKTMSLQIAVGFRVFVCDNLVFAGDVIALRRRHTSGLNLVREIAQAIDRYQDGVLSLERGTHEQLMQTRGAYHSMVLRQMESHEQEGEEVLR